MKRIISLLLCTVLLAGTVISVSLAASAEEIGAAPVAAPVDSEDLATTAADYTPEDSPLHVPKLVVTTEAGNGPELMKEDGYVNAHAVITDTDGSVLEDDAQFKVRGNTTAFGSCKKKAFTIKYAKKKEVLGMGKGKKWALLANAFDPTLLRNYIAFELGRTMGLPYVSKQRIAELWLDGSYRGVYTVTVPVQSGSDRVDIDSDNEESPDFLIETEKSREEEGVTYFTSGGQRFGIQEPEEPSDNKVTYIQNTMDGIFAAIATGDRAQIEQVLDVDSFAKFYIFNEFVKTVDIDFASVFFFYKGGKLYAGPPWDYDFSMAGGAPNVAASYREATPTTGPYAYNKNIFKHLCKLDWFMEEACQVYEDNYSYMYNIACDGGQLDTLAKEYSVEFNNNFTKTEWTIRKWWINYARQPLGTYQENLDFLKNWCFERDLWMTGYFKPFKGEFLIGDADGDDEISVVDVTLITRILSEFYRDEDGMFTLRGDSNLDGLDITDATVIQKYLADFEIAYAIGEPQEYEGY